MHKSESNEHYTPLPIFLAFENMVGSVEFDPFSSPEARMHSDFRCMTDPNTLAGWATEYFFDETDDGFNRDWSDDDGHGFKSAIVNPPGGLVVFYEGKYRPVKNDKVLGRLIKIDGRWLSVKAEKIEAGVAKGSAFVGWEKLVTEYDAGRIEEALFVAFSTDGLIGRTSRLFSFPICFCNYLATDRCITGNGRIKFDNVQDGLRVSGKSPTHGSMLVYLPKKSEYHSDKAGILERFDINFGKFGSCGSFEVSAPF